MAVRYRLVAIRVPDSSGPIEAVIEDLRHPKRGLMWWWGSGYGWETLDRHRTLPDLLQADPTLRAYEMDLPKDFEEGSLVLQGNELRFVYGSN